MQTATLIGDDGSRRIVTSSIDEGAIGGFTKPRLLFFRRHGNLPNFILAQLQQHVKCLSIFFDVRLVSEDGDYEKICDEFQPDLTLVEFGAYGGPPNITGKLASPEIPKLGLLNADAYSATRSNFLSEMERWGIETYFTISVSMPEYMPAVTSQLFIWPNFIDPEIYRDYGQPKIIPVLVTGSQAMHYPWRNRISRIVAQRFPSLICPHFGWFDAQKAARTVYDEEYAKLINSSWVVPTCGTIAREVVRKHFEIPACNSCLVTERTLALEDAGFVDMQNCVFAEDSDVLDKLDFLFDNRDVLGKISRAGYELAHSRHTLQHRDQILQWYKLNKQRTGDQRIVQSRPFGPLTIVDKTSNQENYQSLSNSIDRAILKTANIQLQLGDYDEAERSYLSCLNYHRMPEAFLGLTLSSLKRGDAAAAIRWISQLMTYEFEVDKAIDPDPVEWAYFIIALLCRGDVLGAKRRAHEFPWLQHRELERCRWALDLLNHSANPSSLSTQRAATKSRPSIHQVPETDLISWFEELCRMLIACRQGQLAEKLHTSLHQNRPDISLPSYFAHAASMERPADRMSPRNIVSLISETLYSEVRQRAPLKFVTLVASLKSMFMRGDEFASAVNNLAQREQASSALLLGPSQKSAYAHAFLKGIQKNPSMPKVVCVGSSTKDFRRLRKQFEKLSQITFSSRSLEDAREEAGLKRFELVLIDNCALTEVEAVSAVNGSKTILVRDINTLSGHAVAEALLLRGEYVVFGDSMSDVGRSMIFTRVNGVG